MKKKPTKRAQLIQLLHINTQLYEGTIRVLRAQNQDIRQDNAELRRENRALRSKRSVSGGRRR